MSRKMQGSLKHAYIPGLIVMLAASGCSFEDPQPETVGICVDPKTNQRIEDERCGDWDDDGNATGGGGFFFMWVDLGSNRAIPATGQRVPADLGSRTPTSSARAVGAPQSRCYIGQFYQSWRPWSVVQRKEWRKLTSLYEKKVRCPLCWRSGVFITKKGLQVHPTGDLGTAGPRCGASGRKIEWSENGAVLLKEGS